MLKGMKLQYLEAGSVFAARLQMNQEIVDLSNAFCDRDRHIRGMDDDSGNEAAGLRRCRQGAKPLPLLISPSTTITILHSCERLAICFLGCISIYLHALV